VKRGKKYNESLSKLDRTKSCSFEEAVELLKGVKYTNFDESVEMAVNLNILQKHTIRDTVVLPHGTGKKINVLVFAKADKAEEAKEAGADYVGATDLIEKIKGGWFDFDVAVATPDMMREVGKVGKLLGKRGLMPNPKTQTVTNNIKQTVGELKRGRVEFRADKTRIVHNSIGKLSMDSGAIIENCKALYNGILQKRPSDLKGEYIKSVYISSTMSPGIKIDHRQVG